MPAVTDVRDEQLRSALEGARDLLRRGHTADAVRACADAFLRLAALRPEECRALASPDLVRVSPATVHWPDYGARLVLEPGEAGDGLAVVFDRERFALSEAIAYYEFTVSRAVTLGV